MLTKQAIYLVSDEIPRAHMLKSPWKKHIRNRSDMTHFIRSAPRPVSKEVNQAAGILHKASSSHKSVRPYAVIQLQELMSVEIGLFDQSFRLSCAEPEKVFSCVTRDAGSTATFLRQLMDVLSLLQGSDDTALASLDQIILAPLDPPIVVAEADPETPQAPVEEAVAEAEEPAQQTTETAPEPEAEEAPVEIDVVPEEPERQDAEIVSLDKFRK